MRVGDLAIVGTKEFTGALALDLDAAQRRATQETIVARQRQQPLDSRLGQQLLFVSPR